MASTSASPLVIIVAITRSDHIFPDSGFAFDAARWVKRAKRGGVPDENIKVFGKFYWNPSLGVLQDVHLQNPQFDVSNTDFEDARARYLQPPQKDWKKIAEQVASLDFEHYSCVTFVLLNHGADDGSFGGNCFDRKSLAAIIARIPRPALVIASQCSAKYLFTEVVKLNKPDVLRLYDDGNSERAAYAWQAAQTDDGPILGGTLLSACLLQDVLVTSLSGMYQNVNKIHRVPMTFDECIVKIVAEGDTTLLQTVPFLGGRSSTGWRILSPETKVVRSGLVHEDPSVRPGVHPRLVEILNTLSLPPDFWERAYNPKSYDEVQLIPGSRERIFLLCDVLRQHHLLDLSYPAGLLCYALICVNLDAALIKAVSEYQ